MPEETPKETTEVKTVEVEKPQGTKSLNFKKTKFITYSLLALLVAVISFIASYMIGYDNGAASNKPTLEVKKDDTKKTEKIEDIIEAGLGEEVKVKNGITIKLEQAEIDQSYEKQKQESKDYYEKNTTQSAYLETDYFKNSYLKLRVSLSNGNKVAIAYNLGSFRLKDSEDVQYVYSTGEDKSLYNLNPNETTKIALSFYVPSGERSFKLIFDNAVISFKLK